MEKETKYLVYVWAKEYWTEECTFIDIPLFHPLTPDQQSWVCAQTYRIREYRYFLLATCVTTKHQSRTSLCWFLTRTPFSHGQHAAPWDVGLSRGKARSGGEETFLPLIQFTTQMSCKYQMFITTDWALFPKLTRLLHSPKFITEMHCYPGTNHLIFKVEG